MGPNDTPVPFQANKVGQWTSTLVENVLKELAEKNSEAAKNGQQKFKYVGMQTPSDAARKQTLMMRAPGHWQSGSGLAAAAARNLAHSLLRWSLGRLATACATPTVVGTARARNGARKSERGSAHYPRLTRRTALCPLALSVLRSDCPHAAKGGRCCSDCVRDLRR